MRSHGSGLRYATAETSLGPCNLRNAWADMYHIHEARSRVAREDVEKRKKSHYALTRNIAAQTP